MRLNWETWDTIDTGIKLENYKMYQTNFKQAFITKTTNVCKPFTFDKDTHYMASIESADFALEMKYYQFSNQV